MSKLLRQGDVLLKPIDSIPSGATETEERILARGETTGHSHKLTGKAKVYNNNGQLLVLAEQGVKLVHEEHKQIEIPQGTYEVVRQREYNPIAERQVSD